MGKPLDKRAHRTESRQNASAIDDPYPLPVSPDEAYLLVKHFMRIENPIRRAEIIQHVRDAADEDMRARLN